MADLPLDDIDRAAGWPRLGADPVIMAGLGVLLIALFTLSVAMGSVTIPLPDILTILTGGEAKASWHSIVWLFRLPKALTATLVGAGLAVAGLQMQTLFRNPLAGPFVLGISSGASLGVAFVVLMAGTTAGTSTFLVEMGLIGDVGIVVAASLGAGVVASLVLIAAQRVPTMTLLILGLMVSYITGALVSLLIYFSATERIRAYISWTFGNFGGVTWDQLRVLAPAILIGLAAAFALSKSLNAMLLGEGYAHSMGLDVGRMRFAVIGGASVLAGAATAFCGPIGFIGIAVPHLCRGLFSTSDHRILVPSVAMVGGAVALAADLIAQMPGSQTVLPLNAITALLGAPIVIWIILKRS